MPTFTLATSRTVCNPVRPQQWNVSIRGGDDFRLVLTVYEDDDGTLADVTGAASRLYLRRDGRGPWVLWDYGACFLDGPRGADWPGDGYGRGYGSAGVPSGTVMDGPAGRIDFAMPGTVTADLCGRYLLLVQVVLADGGMTQVEGILQARRGGPVVPALLPPVVVPPVVIPPALLFGIGALDPAIGEPGIGIFDDIGLLPAARPGQGTLGQFRLG